MYLDAATTFDWISKVLAMIGGIIGAIGGILGIRAHIALRKKETSSREAEEADMQIYTQVCAAMQATGGNTYSVEPGSADHLWAERMFKRGCLSLW